MDIKTLEALGINAEDLTSRIVDQAVEALLSSSGYDPENDIETRYESRFKKEIEKRVLEATNAKIAALAEVHVVPRVGEMIEQANMVQTNGYGESKSPPMTFKEFIAKRAEVYMAESVDMFGKSKSESGDQYNWRDAGPRLTVLMKMYIQKTMEDAAKTAVNDVNKVIAENIKKAAIQAITQTVAGIKVSVAT